MNLAEDQNKPTDYQVFKDVFPILTNLATALSSWHKKMPVSNRAVLRRKRGNQKSNFNPIVLSSLDSPEGHRYEGQQCWTLWGNNPIYAVLKGKNSLEV